MKRGAIAGGVADRMKSASWIREMFEKGLRLKAELGVENVFDFSLGNPFAPPPSEFFAALRAVAQEQDAALHRYMPNAGFPEARAAVAAHVKREYGWDAAGDDVVLTTGAAGGLNVVLRAICDPGDEVIVLAPYFPEYSAYVEQAGGRLVVVQTDADFEPDAGAVAAAISARTRAIIINTPNNPSGAVHSEASCRALADALQGHDAPDRPLYAVLDDPYRRLVFDVDKPSSVGDTYPRTILVSSFSKDLSLAGERAGFIALRPGIAERGALLGALIMLNRTLGMVNMPAVMQRVIARCAAARCEIGFYRRNRDAMCDGLARCGYSFVRPGGAMFVFPQTPIDDVAFIDVLARRGVLAVPGKAFGRPGHIRISLAVEPELIERALPHFSAALRECGFGASGTSRAAAGGRR